MTSVPALFDDVRDLLILARVNHMRKMAENSRSRRSLQFQCADPLSREAASRTTRYRILKKRKAEENLETNSSDQDLPCAEPSQDLQFLGSDNEQEQQGDSEREQQGNNEQEQDCDLFSDEPLTELLPEEPETHDVLDLPSEDNEDVGDSPLQIVDNAAGCAAVVSSCSVLVKKYSVHHNLTQEALADLLQLLRLYSSTPDILPQSLYLFEKQFESLKYPLTIHYFCSDCLQVIPNRHIQSCPNEFCRKSFQSVGAVSSFVEMPLQLQLINLLQRT